MPSPLGAATPLLALAAAALVLEAAPELPWEAGVVVAALFLAAASVRLVHRWLEVRRLRALADRVILHSREHPSATPLVTWRTAELTGARHRRALATQALRLGRESDAAGLPNAVPLNRVAVRRSRAELEQLADVLAGFEPVSAHGVLLAEQLLSSLASPLYNPVSADVLRTSVRRVLFALPV